MIDNFAPLLSKTRHSQRHHCYHYLLLRGAREGTIAPWSAISPAPVTAPNIASYYSILVHCAISTSFGQIIAVFF